MSIRACLCPPHHSGGNSIAVKNLKASIELSSGSRAMCDYGTGETYPIPKTVKLMNPAGHTHDFLSLRRSRAAR
jgi:hypothetical protein